MDNVRILPPRKNLTPTKISKQYLSPLQTLLQMGFHRNKAEKALAATGDRGAQLAADWLLAHVNDPTLDTLCPREYILYACPTGEFLHELETFWESSLVQCGWNGAHNSIPHVTLVSFFKAPDEYSLQLTQTMEQVVKQEIENNSTFDIKLEPYASTNFMGFFVSEENATLLKHIALQYVKEVSSAIINDNYEQLDAIATCFPWCTNPTSRFSVLPRNIQSLSLEPHVKSLHLTLAFQFPTSEYDTLKHLLDSSFDLSTPTVWEIRLYSRDIRAAGKHVYKVVYSHIPRESDELELRIGDFIYVSEESVKNSPDAWVEGISWLTGCSGYFPINYTERTAETDAWTLHRSVPLYQETSESDLVKSRLSQEVFSIMEENNSSIESQDISCLLQEQNSAGPEPTQIFIMRHGERVDFTFGKWIPYCFTKDGKYVRKDLNMPVSVPERKGSPETFAGDTPLTCVGVFEANSIGEAFKNLSTQIKYVYCSPALRSIQTCSAVLTGLGISKSLPICVEPSLFEWLTWYQSGIPEFLTTDELTAAGLNINVSYKPLITIDQLKNMMDETCEQYYERSYVLVKKALETAAEKGGGNILFVGHASSVDTCSRQLLGLPPRDRAQLDSLLLKIPYCSTVQVRQDSNKWKLAESPAPPFSNSVNKRFDWKVLLPSE